MDAELAVTPSVVGLAELDLTRLGFAPPDSKPLTGSATDEGPLYAWAETGTIEVAP